MSSLTVLAVGLAVVGVVLLAMSLLWDLRNNVHGTLFGNALLKLLNAGNRDRALKVCNSILSTSPYSVVARGALELRIPTRDPQAGPAADYRSPVAERPFELRVREALSMLVRAGARSVDRSALQSMVGCIFIGAAAILAATTALLSLDVAVGAVLVVLVIAGLNLRKRARIKRELVQLSDLLQPFVERADV